MKKTIIVLMLFAHAWCFASPSPPTLISNSKQLIIATTTDWKSIGGQIQRFQRNSIKDYWQAVGKTIPVVVGKHGMGLDFHLKNKQADVPIKQEGDNLTPAGVYTIDTIFGFDEKSHNNKM